MIKTIKKYCSFFIVLGFIIISISAKAQYTQYPFAISYYQIVNYDSNKLKFPEGRANFTIFYQKLNKLIEEGNSQLNIVQYGGSHIQADIFSGECRTRFQSFEGGLNAGRGFVYPYRLAHTNTPFGYYFRYKGNWKTCRNVERKKSCSLGMAGISSITKDSLSSLTLLIEPDNDLDYSFNRIRIYHSIDTMSYAIRIDSQMVDSQKTVVNLGYTEFYLNHLVDSLTIDFYKANDKQKYFQLFGFDITNGDPGIVYHNLGINGAATTSFLRCNRMQEELKSIHPDLVIFGIGINDAYGRNFSQASFEHNYDSLVGRVLAVNPEAAIIFATNNDSYIHHRFLNRNGLKVEESMYRLAKKYHAAVWDMFEIMGGLNSIVVWQKDYLARRDRVHFTRTGYILLGNLLFDAIIKDYGNYLQENSGGQRAMNASDTFLKRRETN